MSNGAVLAALLVILSSQAERREPHEGDWEWLSEHRFEAFDILMPLKTEYGFAPVTFRSYRDLYQDVREHYFQITEPDRDSLRATVVAPIGKSIQQQMLELHMGDPTASFEAVLQRVQVESIVLHERDCPAIRHRLEVLETLRFAIPNPNSIIIHPVVYWVSIDTNAGEFLAQLTVEDHPLVLWATETEQELQKCIDQVGR